MSDVLTEQLAEVKAQLEAAKAENQAIKAQIEEAKDKEFASKIQAYEVAAEESKATIEQLGETIKSTEARVAELEDALAQSTEQLAQAKEYMEEMKKKEKMEKRKAALVEAGFEAEDVDAALAAFDGLADEAFDSVVAMYGKKPKANKKEDEAEAGMPPEVKEAIEKKKKEKEAKADEAEAELSEDAFEDVETSEATMVEPEAVDELDQARASVADWFSNHVLTNK